MLTAVVSFLVGIASSAVAQLFWESIGKNMMRQWRYRKGHLHMACAADTLQIGTCLAPWLVVATGPWDPVQIHSSYRAGVIPRGPVVELLYAEVCEQVRASQEAGRPAPFNGLGYQLESFWVGGRTVQTEDCVIDLRFRPTDYFMMLATDQQLDRPIFVADRSTTLRKEFAAQADLALHPVNEFATHWGIALQVISRDGLTIFAERGQTAVDSMVFFPSVAEGASRPTDDDGHGGPDIFRTAIRGTMEELGIDLLRDEITWLSFGANTVLCEYGMIGTAHSRYDMDDIITARAVGRPKDKWESSKLHYPLWTPEAVATFVHEHGPWSPFALITLYHALMHDYPYARVKRAFAGSGIRMSQAMPPEA